MSSGLAPTGSQHRQRGIEPLSSASRSTASGARYCFFGRFHEIAGNSVPRNRPAGRAAGAFRATRPARSGAETPRAPPDPRCWPPPTRFSSMTKDMAVPFSPFGRRVRRVQAAPAPAGSPSWMCQTGLPSRSFARPGARQASRNAQILVDGARDHVEGEPLGGRGPLEHEERQAFGRGIAHPVLDRQAVSLRLRDLLPGSRRGTIRS